jgi:predicted amidohydrolase
MLVAAVQMKPVFKDKMGNLRAIAKLVRQASDQGAKLIVLPELATTGYSFMSEAEATEQAEIIHPEIGTTRAMMVLAQTFNAHLAWGMVEKDAGTGSLYNSQVMVGPDGTWVSYRKINRFGSDFLWAKAGRANPPILDIKDGGRTRKVGLLICRDVRDKKDDKWSSFYEKGDADIVAFSAAWGRGGIPANAWMDFVESNNTTLVVSNMYGLEGPNDFGVGGTCIICPPDQVHLDGLSWSQDCIVLGEV